MASAAVRWLGDASIRATGIVVSPEPPASPVPGLRCVSGDHPVPGARSLAAADALADEVSHVDAGDNVFVLISGGTSSLIGAPLSGISSYDYRHAFDVLLRSGLDIDAMNAIRKQISRWANGRLALALEHARVQPVIISDVPGDDAVTVGSGPCTFDPASAHRALEALRSCRPLDALPSSVRLVLEQVPQAGAAAHHSASNVAPPLIAPHTLVVESILAAARELGLAAVAGPALSGDAQQCGQMLVSHFFSRASTQSPTVVVSGGETTVTLGDSHGLGGRCQELALSAAEALSRSAGQDVTLLIAGTDGRDGPTDAAGAIVDAGTWRAIERAGRDPSSDLAAHNSHVALDSAGALLRTGLTGTNMLDVAIALVAPRAVK